MGNSDKIVELSDFEKKPFATNKKTVLIGGCFDLLHFGHLTFLKKAKQKGDYLLVALESDKFISEKKRKTPVHNQAQRAEILANLNLVDCVILLPYMKTDNEYFEMVKKINPHVIAVTAGDSQIVNKGLQAGVIGAKLEIVSDHIKGFSTKSIIHKFL